MSLSLLASCLANSDQDDPDLACLPGEKCDNAEGREDGVDQDCLRAMKDFSGKGRTPTDILANDDPLARVFRKFQGNGDAPGEGLCPVSVADVAQELRRDNQCFGVGTGLVSERSQILGKFTDYRAVNMFRCGTGNNPDTVVLHYGLVRQELEAAGLEVQDAAEELAVSAALHQRDPDATVQSVMTAILDRKFPAMIAEGRDPEGLPIVNYYQSSRGELRFFGSSLDMLEGTDLPRLVEDFQDLGGKAEFTDDGEQLFVHRSLDVPRNCAACHPGGGMIMKEFRASWVHWLADFPSPMSFALTSSVPDIMSTRSDAFAVETMVRDSFNETNQGRIQHLLNQAAADGDVTPLLKPLFCPVEFNIMSANPPSTLVATFTLGELSAAVLDHSLSFLEARRPPVPLPESVYLSVLQARGSRLERFRDLGAPFPANTRETLGRLTFVERAASDINYANHLMHWTKNFRAAPIIDLELRVDVAGVDFTRALFSEERCGLLQTIAEHSFVQAPGGARQTRFRSLTPAGIREGLKGALEAALAADPTHLPAQELLANLNEGDSLNRLRGAATAFAEACESLPTEEFATNYVKYIAQQRKRAEDIEAGLAHGDSSFAQFFFPLVKGAVMPIDDEPLELGFRLHPVTCTPTREFVPVNPAVAGG